MEDKLVSGAMWLRQHWPAGAHPQNDQDPWSAPAKSSCWGGACYEVSLCPLEDFDKRHTSCVPPRWENVLRMDSAFFT
eukprot:1841278-Amphidinium_carterae.1